MFLPLLLTILSICISDRTSFESALREIHREVDTSSATKHLASLDELLEAHRGHPYVVENLPLIERTAKRCAFVEAHPPKKLRDSISGRLLKWDGSSKVRIRYRPGGLGDFKEIGDALEHTAVFSGPYSVTLRGASLAPFDDPSNLSCIRVCVDDGSAIELDHGALIGPDGSSVLFQLRRVENGETTMIDSSHRMLDIHDEVELKITVNKLVQVFCNKKKILEARRGKQSWGRLSLPKAMVWDDLFFEGRISPTWARWMCQLADREALKGFEETWSPRETLPSWLYK